MGSAANEDRRASLEINQSDLQAYVAGELPERRRREVEGFLAANPDLAARTMTALHMSGTARRRPRARGWIAAMFGVAVLASVGSGAAVWAAGGGRDLDGWRELDGDNPPDYVEDAAESRQATRLRETMASQVETTQLDAREIHRALDLPLPRLPATWKVRDVQVFPTDDGPSVNLVLDTERGRVELFAVKVRSGTTERPEVARRGRELAAFWERGDAAYVLSGPQSLSDLLSDASTLARSANL